MKIEVGRIGRFEYVILIFFTFVTCIALPYGILWRHIIDAGILRQVFQLIVFGIGGCGFGIIVCDKLNKILITK